MSTQRTFKKGELIFKDGEKVQSIMFIQKGGVNQCLVRGKKNVDLFQLGANQVLGETALLGTPQHATSAIATTETTVVELPIDTVKQQYEGAPPLMKMLIKSLLERLKLAINDVKSSKVSSDSSPCPEEFVPQIYGAMFFAANHKGEKQKDGSVEVEWNMLKNYCQRIFGQSPKRLEQAVAILVKLKLATFQMGKLPEDPDGPEVLTGVTFSNLAIVEGFYEFYQYYYYKPGKNELIKYDEFTAQMLEAFVVHGEKATPDRFGVVSIDFAAVAEDIKERLGIGLNNDHFSRLEQKGVLCKRRTVDNQPRCEFEIKEYQNIHFSWKIIREIDKWNEKGFVDINEKEVPKAKKGGPSCPQCAAEVAPAAKFCQECGCKLQAAA